MDPPCSTCTVIASLHFLLTCISHHAEVMGPVLASTYLQALTGMHSSKDATKAPDIAPSQCCNKKPHRGMLSPFFTSSSIFFEMVALSKPSTDTVSSTPKSYLARSLASALLLSLTRIGNLGLAFFNS